MTPLKLEQVEAASSGVLVVEDDAAVLQMLVVVLQHYGLRVWATSGGVEAVRVYEQHRDAIAVVLLDVQMPGLDGPQTLAALQKLNTQVRVVFMSGYTDSYSVEDLLVMGAARVLLKPFRSLTELIQALGETARPG